MTLREIKIWINKLPEELLDFQIVNGEWGELEDTDAIYRIDKPIIALDVDEESKEVVFLHQKQDEINGIKGE